MGKHTPGPWDVSSGLLVVDKEAHVLANCLSMGPIDELCVPVDEDMANARLIAAAPELLEACKEQLKIMKDFYDEISRKELNETGKRIKNMYERRLEEVIAKAEGR